MIQRYWGVPKSSNLMVETRCFVDSLGSTGLTERPQGMARIAPSSEGGPSCQLCDEGGSFDQQGDGVAGSFNDRRDHELALAQADFGSFKRTLTGIHQRATYHHATFQRRSSEADTDQPKPNSFSQARRSAAVAVSSVDPMMYDMYVMECSVFIERCKIAP